MEVFSNNPVTMLQVCAAIMSNAFATKLCKISNLDDILSVHGEVSTFWLTLIQVNQLTKVTMVPKPGTIESNVSDSVHLKLQ